MQELSEAVYEFLEGCVPKKDIIKNEPMDKHTTFRIGGEAACFVRISTQQQLVNLIPYLNRVGIEYFVLGNGSNLLVSDKGYSGVILQINDKFDKIDIEGTVMKVQSGALLSRTAKCALEHGLTGLEFASGIPGTIGGGVVMNAGAYEGEMQQIVESVKVLSKSGEILELDNSTMEFGYRTSIIKNRDFTVLEVTLKLKEGDRGEIQSKMNELNARRRAKQPLEFPSAGSTFKRPDGYFAGKLIMDAGLRGYSVGGAKISEKHCGFVVNAGKATATDVADVIAEVQEKVKDKFGVSLEKEIVYLGEF